MAMTVNNGLVAFLLRLRAQQDTDQNRANCDALLDLLTERKETSTAVRANQSPGRAPHA